MDQAYLGLIFEAFPNPIVVFDMTGTAVIANRAALAVFGPRASEIDEGKYNVFEQPFISELDGIEKLKRVTRGEIVRFSEVKIEKEDGINVYRDVDVFPITSADGSVVSFASVTRDVTDRVEAKRQLAESLGVCKRLNNSTINSISRIIELRDPYTAGHQTRVSELACEIAGDMGLSQVEIERMRIAGLVHDLGKILLPSEILSKPGALTEYEYAIIKKHPEAGLSVLDGADFDQIVIDIVSQHHERIDGSGYPHGLTGDSISKEARIFAVADVVEAMAAHRPYRPSLGIEAALREIEKKRGVQFDAEVVDSCLRLFREKGFKFTELNNFYSGNTR